MKDTDPQRTAGVRKSMWKLRSDLGEEDHVFAPEVSRRARSSPGFRMKGT